jgi:SPP1 gp7 family putative phage head morphogenesis protein
MGFNEDMADRITARSLTVARFAESTRRDVVRQLHATEKRLIELLEHARLGEGRLTKHARARLEKLLVQTRETIRTDYSAIASDHRQRMVDLAQIEVVHFKNAARASIGVDVMTVALSRQQLGAIASDTLIQGARSREWWGRQAEGMQRRFSDTVRTGMVMGHTTDQLVRDIKGTQLMQFRDGIRYPSTREAEALVRTSVQATANEARDQLYEANQDLIKGIQWVATLDDRTTVICAALNGLMWSLPDYEPIGHDQEFPGPTAHWNCRSTQVAVFKSWSELSGRPFKTPAGGSTDAQGLWERNLREQGLSDSQIRSSIRDARSSMDGEVPAAKTFGQWLDGKSKTFHDDFLGPGKADLWRAGEISLRDMVDQSNRPLTLEALRRTAGA